MKGFYDGENKYKDRIREELEYQYVLWKTPNRQKEYSQEVVDILEEILEG